MRHLQGKHILLTRTTEQNKQTSLLVKSYGAIPQSFSCAHIEYLKHPIQQAWQDLSAQKNKSVDVIFSSRNGVLAVASSVEHFTEILQGLRVVAVGQKTAQALQTYHVDVAFVPEETSQQGLIQAYKHHGISQQAYFFRAQEGSDDLQHYLNAQQVATQLVPAYKTSCDSTDASQVIEGLQHKKIDAVLLGSARTALFYTQKVGNLALANQPTIAVMSTQVAEAADKLGLDVQVIAKEPSFKAILDGLNHHFATKE